MSVRALYVAVGAAWGATLGVLVGLAAFAAVFGARWIAVFGDESWPTAAEWSLFAAGLLAGLGVFAVSLVAGWRYGDRAAAVGSGLRRARRTGLGLLGLWAVTAAGLAALAVVGIDREAADRRTAEAQDAAFAGLLAARHTIDRVEFFGWNADAGTAGVVMRGNRSGDYQIVWQVTEPAYGRVLAEGSKTVTLGPGRRTVVIPLDRAALIAAYRASVATGAAGAKVDEALRLAVMVEPVPSAAERASLPPHELQNLAIGQSLLRSGGEADVPISFQTSAAAQTD